MLTIAFPIAVSWISFGTDYIGNDWSWRIPAIIQAFPSVIQLAFIWCKSHPPTTPVLLPSALNQPDTLL